MAIHHRNGANQCSINRNRYNNLLSHGFEVIFKSRSIEWTSEMFEVRDLVRKQCYRKSERRASQKTNSFPCLMSNWIRGVGDACNNEKSRLGTARNQFIELENFEKSFKTSSSTRRVQLSSNYSSFFMLHKLLANLQKNTA